MYARAAVQPSIERIDRAVMRVLGLKKRKIVFKVNNKPLDKMTNTVAHREISKEIASRVLKKIGSDFDLSFKNKKVAVFVSKILKSNIDQTSLPQIGKITNPYYFSSLNPLDSEIDKAKKEVEVEDALLAFFYNTWKRPSQIEMIETLINTKKLVVLVIVENPLDASFFLKLALFSILLAVPSIQAVSDQLSYL